MLASLWLLVLSRVSVKRVSIAFTAFLLTLPAPRMWASPHAAVTPVTLTAGRDPLTSRCASTSQTRMEFPIREVESRTPANADSGSAKAGRSCSERPTEAEATFSFSAQTGLVRPQTSVPLSIPKRSQASIGFHTESLLSGSHGFHPVAEMWSLREDHQYAQTLLGAQILDTKLHAMAAGVEYLYRFGGPMHHLSVGSSLFLVRWSLETVNTLALAPAGRPQSNFSSEWNRCGDSLTASYSLSRRLEVHSRYIQTRYSAQRRPVTIAVVGAGWHF